MSNDLDLMQAQLDIDPGDWLLRRIIADYYEEQGNDILCTGQHWLIRHRKYPQWVKDGAWWWTRKWNAAREHYELEAKLWDKLLGAERIDLTYNQKFYVTRIEAETDLCLALQREDIHQDLWKKKEKK